MPDRRDDRMTLSPPLRETLLAVSATMAAARDPWWIITGAAVALHGVDAGPVGDVDVLISVADGHGILAAIGVDPDVRPAHPKFRSALFGTWHAPPLPVEFMAGFCHYEAAQWVAVRPRTRERIAMAGGAVFVPDRTELERMLRRFGRPKDIVRADRLSAAG